MHRSRRLSGTLALIALLSSCGGGEKATGVEEKPSAAVAVVSITPDTLSLPAGADTTLVAVAKTTDGVAIPDAVVTWASSDSSVVSVGASGVISAKKFGRATVTAVSGGVTGSAKIQTLAPPRDSLTISEGDTTRAVTGMGSSVVVAPSAGLSGERVVVEEVAPPEGTEHPLGPAIKVSVVSSSGESPGSRRDAAGASDVLTVRVSVVTSVPPVEVPAGASKVAFYVSGGGSLSPTPVLRVSDSEDVGTSGTGAPTITSRVRVTMDGGEPLLVVPVWAGSACDVAFSDDKRLYLARKSPYFEGSSPLALVLIHGWQWNQRTCDAALAWRPEEGTWKSFLAQYFPEDGSPGKDDRLQLFDTWIVHYPTQESVATNGGYLASVLAKRLAGKKIVVLAHSMGGLVAAAAMQVNESLPIDTIVALGTPWRGSPLPGGWWTSGSAAQACLSVPAEDASLIVDLMTNTEGARSLRDGPAGYLATTLAGEITKLDSRITTIAGNIRIIHTSDPHDDWKSFLATDLGDCLMAADGREPSDGFVPLSSATDGRRTQVLKVLDGTDHVQLTSRSDAESDALGLAIGPLLAYLGNHAPVASVVVSPASSSLAVGTNAQLSAALIDAAGSDELRGRATTWTSDNEGVAAVDRTTGVVTGVTPGAATITATSEGVTGTATVTVSAVPVSVASVTVSPASASIVVGATQQLSSTVKDANGNTLTDRTVTWASATASVATVDQHGLVTGVAAGTATISATSEGVTGTAKVTVSSATQSYTVSVAASPSGGGQVNGEGTYAAGASVTVRATAATGYAFVAWTENGATVSESSTYTFSIDRNRTLVAGFQQGTAPTIALSATSKAFTANAGGDSPAAETIQITNAGTGTLSGLSATVSYQEGQPGGWLSAALSTTTAPATLTLTPALGALTAGSYNATTAITSAASGVTNSPQQVSVTLTLTSTAGVATKLLFVVSPSSASVGVPFSPAIQVGVADANGDIVTTATNNILLQIVPGTGAPGALFTDGQNDFANRSVNASAGIATFSGLAIGTAGANYQLQAIDCGNSPVPGDCVAPSERLAGVTSAPFNVTNPASSLIVATPSSLTFEAFSNGPRPLFQAVTITSADGAVHTGLDLATPLPYPWVVQRGGATSTPATFGVGTYFNSSTVSSGPGTYTGTATFHSDDPADGVAEVPLTLIVSGETPPNPHAEVLYNQTSDDSEILSVPEGQTRLMGSFTSGGTMNIIGTSTSITFSIRKAANSVGACAYQIDLSSGSTLATSFAEMMDPPAAQVGAFQTATKPFGYYPYLLPPNTPIQVFIRNTGGCTLELKSNSSGDFFGSVVIG